MGESGDFDDYCDFWDLGYSVDIGEYVDSGECCDYGESGDSGNLVILVNMGVMLVTLREGTLYHFFSF